MKTKPLTERQKKFTQEYLKTGNKRKAALAAGYSAKNLDHVGFKLTHKHAVVSKVIAEAQKEVQKKMAYTLESAMRECDDTISFARETENANAMAKAVELKAKLNGLLVEKHEHSGAALQIQINRFDSGSTSPKVIDAQAESPVLIESKTSSEVDIFE